MISNGNETSKFQSSLIESLHLCAFHILKHSLSSLSISQVTFYNVVPLISVSERSYKCRSFFLLFIIKYCYDNTSFLLPMKISHDICLHVTPSPSRHHMQVPTRSI